VKIRPPSPTRVCLKKAGPCEVSRINATVARSTGALNIKSPSARIYSATALAIRHREGGQNVSRQGLRSRQSGASPSRDTDTGAVIGPPLPLVSHLLVRRGCFVNMRLFQWDEGILIIAWQDEWSLVLHHGVVSACMRNRGAVQDRPEHADT